MNQDLEVKSITKKELEQSIATNLFWESHAVPISKNKATWICNNQRIAQDDYCAFIALSNKEVVSFILVIPDLMQLSDKSNEKIYWFLEWWVAPEFEKSVLGPYIFKEAMRLTKNKVLIKSYAEKTSLFYEKQPFSVISDRPRFTIFFSLNPDILIGKFKILKYVKPLLSLANIWVRWGIKKINEKKAAPLLKPIQFEYVRELSEANWEVLGDFCSDDLIYKTRAYVNWQVNADQYLQVPNETAKTYHPILNGFSNGISPNINLFNVNIFKDGELIGFFSFLRNYDEAYIKYLLCEGYHLKYITASLIKHFIELNISHVFTDNSLLSKEIAEKYKKVFVYKVRKKALAHNDLSAAIVREVTEQDGHFI